MPSQEDINYQLERLRANRTTLRQLLLEQARYGVLTPPGIEQYISIHRADIRRIKGTLRDWGVKVEDDPDDREYPPETPSLDSDHAQTLEQRTTAIHPECNQVFISYSHNDLRWLEQLQVQLRPLERQGIIVRWDDTMIKPGSKWREEIDKALKAAKVAILLVSANFLASDFIITNELPPLLQAAEEEGAVILPVIISPCRFEQTESLSRFQAVNPPSEYLRKLPIHKREEVFVRVAEIVEKALLRNDKLSNDTRVSRVKFTRQQKNSLYHALLPSSTDSTLATLIANIGLNPKEMPSHQDIAASIIDVLGWVNERGYIKQFILAACELHSTNVQLRAIAQEILGPDA